MGYRFYRYSYNRNRSSAIYSQPQNTDVNLSDPLIGQRIDNLATKPGLTDWEKNFLTSIKDFFDRKKSLTSGQYNTFQKIETRLSDEKIEAQKQFTESFSQEMRDDMVLLAKIYRNLGSPYYRELIKSLLENPSFVPTLNQYEKFVKTKYAEGYLKAAKSKPKFDVAQAVKPSSQYKDDYIRMPFKGAIVIDNDSLLPISYANGAKRYTILPFGQTQTLIVEERELKNHS